MVEAAEANGLSAEQSKELVIETFLGASETAKSSNLSLAELQKNVTSAGGTTEAGLKALQGNNELSELINSAIKAAKDRSVELSN